MYAKAIFERKHKGVFTMLKLLFFSCFFFCLFVFSALSIVVFLYTAL